MTDEQVRAELERIVDSSNNLISRALRKEMRREYFKQQRRLRQGRTRVGAANQPARRKR